MSDYSEGSQRILVVDIAVELIKLGAREYVTKPVEPTEFIQRIKTSLRAVTAELRVRELQAEFSSRLLHDLRGPVVTLSSALVFDKYKDMLTGKSSNQKTTGLGLAICRSIVEAHNGKMTAESEVNKGTTFRIYLPTEEI